MAAAIKLLARGDKLKIIVKEVQIKTTPTSKVSAYARKDERIDLTHFIL